MCTNKKWRQGTGMKRSCCAKNSGKIVSPHILIFILLSCLNILSYNVNQVQPQTHNYNLKQY